MSAWHRLHARRRNSAATAMIATQYASRITWGLRIEVIATFSGSGARGVEKVSTSPAWPTQVRIPVEVAPPSEVLTSVSTALRRGASALHVVALRGRAALAGRRLRPPLPAADLRHVVAVLADVLLVLDQLLVDRLLEVRGAGAELRQ